MRILMAVPKYPFPVAGGLERQAHALAQALVRRGHSVTALSTRFDRSQRTIESVDGVRILRVRWVEFKPVRFLMFPFSLARRLFGVRGDIDLVHVHNISWFGAFVTIFARLFGLPVITKLPGNGDFGIPMIRRRTLGIFRLALLKRCDAIIAMTPESATELESIGYPARRVLKVTNGIPLLPAVVRRPRSEPLTAVFVGRLSWEKGLPELLNAWASVKSAASRPVLLRIIGDGPLERELRKLSSTLGLGDSVEFAGFAADVASELATADLFVLPSYSEGNSNSVLEAMRAGLPIVATRVGGTPIQVGAEGDDLLVPPGDFRALAEKLLEVIENETLRLNSGVAMRARTETIFDIDRIASTYEQAYGLILRGQREQIGKINSSLFVHPEGRDLQCAE
ncbi:MAG: glycosyltransferase family 4 protein [Acidobacteriota bacterium]